MQKNMVLPSSTRYQRRRAGKEQKGKTVERQNRLETLCQSINIKWKWCNKNEEEEKKGEHMTIKYKNNWILIFNAVIRMIINNMNFMAQKCKYNSELINYTLSLTVPFRTLNNISCTLRKVIQEQISLPMAWYRELIVVGWWRTRISPSNSQHALGFTAGDTITIPFLICDLFIWKEASEVTHRCIQDYQAGNHHRMWHHAIWSYVTFQSHLLLPYSE